MSIPALISFFFVAFTALAIEHFTRSKGASPPDAVAAPSSVKNMGVVLFRKYAT